MTRTALHAQLMQDEGFRAAAYQDTMGYWTIGFGRLIDARKGGGLTREEAGMLLQHDIDRLEVAVRSRFPWFASLDPARQDVVLNMAFTLGVSGLARFTMTLACVASGDYAGAADGMMRSLWARQVGARAQRLAAVMRG